MNLQDISLDRLTKTFEILSNWEERFQYVIDLGKKLPPLDASYKTEEHRVRGCTSRVWILNRIEDGILHFDADSDASIVKGLIAILMIILNDKPVEDVVKTDVELIFKELGLENNLSPSRTNGFFSMVQCLKKDALLALLP